MKPLKFFILTIFITLLVFVSPAVLVIVFDPFFVLHKPYFMEKPLFDGTDRYQNAGLINSFLTDPSAKYDTIIIGTSMSQNFPVDEHTLKLTLAGGQAKELAMLAQKALQTGRVKRVIWEVFTPYIHSDVNAVHAESPLPEFLYNDTAWDDWRYIFNNDVLEESLKVARKSVKKRKPLETLYTWEDEGSFLKFQSPENLEKMQNELRNTLPLSFSNSDQHRFPNVEQNLISVLASYPDVDFDLFFPPVSYYQYAREGSEGFSKEMQMRETVLEAVKDMPNVRVFGFDLIDGIGNDIMIYRDAHHYKPEVNAKIMASIEASEHQLTLKKWPSYMYNLVEQINVFSKEFIQDKN